MTSRLTEVIVDCADAPALARFWAEALGYEEAQSGDGWIALRAPGQNLDDEVFRESAQPPAVVMVTVPEGKSAKNRVHVDITPYDCTQTEEVARLEALGATHVDSGQRGKPWVLLADPEGNEFCVMPELDQAAAPE